MIVGKVLRSFTGSRRYEAGELLTQSEVAKWRHQNKKALSSLGYVELYAVPVEETVVKTAVENVVERKQPIKRGRPKIEVSTNDTDESKPSDET